MERTSVSSRSAVWLALAAAIALSLAGGLLATAGDTHATLAPSGMSESSSAAGLLDTWTFSGRVYDGVPFTPVGPIQGVTVSVYGANNRPSVGNYGTFLRSITTSSTGWWSLSVYDDDRIWEYYSLVETDPQGYTSVDATSVDGTKLSKNCIFYEWPLSGKTFTGNKFWDRGPTTATPTRTYAPRPTSTPTRTQGPVSSTTPTQTPRETLTPSQTPRESPTPSLTPEEPGEPGPVTFPGGEWPWYAQGEITIHPEPPVAGNLTRLCAEVVNRDPQQAHVATLEFRVANFGIGLSFDAVGKTDVHVPPGGAALGCVIWTPPMPGHWCIEIVILQPGCEPQHSQRNIDMDEPLEPGVPHRRVFPVGNPFNHPVTVTLGLIPHLPDWQFELSQDVLPDVPPGEVREVTLTVGPPPEQSLPPAGHPIVDVEAFVEGQLIGGFRKIFRPPVTLHRFPDPGYAESEITVHPYPPRAGEPTEICVELRNPSDVPQSVTVLFSWAAFGIGLPFTPIDGPRVVHLPPHSIVNECLHWIPPVGGNICLQVELEMEGYPPQRSQRNLDVHEPLEPGVPHTRVFPVHNPFSHPVTVTLGLIPHLPDWQLELSQDVLPNMAPHETREVSLTVVPPPGQPLPPDGQPIVDVEAFVGGELIGGFRKIHRPPVPVHQPKDPIYAETEIGVDPYPAIAGQPTQLSVELRNPTEQDQVVMVTFAVGPFGLGLPFDTDYVHPNPIQIFVPANGAARGHVIWDPPDWSGKFCVQVRLDVEGHEPVFSRRNIDVGEPLRPGEPHVLSFPVSTGHFTAPVTITLGLINHMPGWEATLGADMFPDVPPGETITTTLTVVPAGDAALGSGLPIVDVEAYVDGELIGGFRKLDVPPVPLHKPHEKGYAESEIRVFPYPPLVDQQSKVSAVLQNASADPVTVNVEFGWANFGMGIPFRNDGMVPPNRSVTVGAGLTTTVDVTWTPIQSGHQCILVRLSDAEGLYEPQVSQRNVDVEQRPPCNVTKVFTFTVYNDSPLTATVDLGLITFDVPANWQVTTEPTGSVPVGPHSELVVTVMVKIPCPGTSLASQQEMAIRRLQRQAGGIPTIDVEGYIDGKLVGGIEIRFADQEPMATLNLPLILRGG